MSDRLRAFLWPALTLSLRCGDPTSQLLQWISVSPQLCERRKTCRSRLASEEAGTDDKDLQPAETTKPASIRALFQIHPGSEAEHFHIRPDRRGHRDLRLLFLFYRRCCRLGCRLARDFGDRWLIGQRLERHRQLLGQALQQHALRLDLSRRTTGMLFLQMDDAVVTDLSATVDQAPLRVEDRRLFCTRIQARDSCLLYTSPSPRDGLLSRMPSSA